MKVFFTLKRPAFSMLELVFVIAILGIVSSIGAELIAKVYQNYIVQRALHRSSTKTELVANQIVNRLSYAIPRTVIGRPDTTIFQALNNIPLDAGYNILEWVAYDNDSFSSRTVNSVVAGWSGFVDVDNPSTTKDVLITLGSNLLITNTIIANLSQGNDKDISDSAVFFPAMYNEDSIGYVASNSALNISTVSNGVGETLTLDAIDANTRRIIKEHYKLAWSAYALVPTIQANGLFSIDLHSNFQPWNGESYLNAKISTLIRNVSVFNFMGSGNTIRFKLCVQEDIGTITPITTCKEKVVFR